MKNIRIALADDENLFREGLANLLCTNPEYELVAQAENGKKMLEKIRRLTILPDIALMDLNMPEMNGVELNYVLQKEYPTIKVIILSIYSDDKYISKMIEAGACGYLKKNSETWELFETLNNTAKLGFYFNSDVVKALRNSVHYRKQSIQNLNNIPITLTEREVAILRMICNEFTNAEIAEKLFISHRTVDGHRTNLLSKTGCKNTAGLVIFAIRYGIFEVMAF